MVVDEDVDVQNVSEVAWKALNNIDPERDIQFVMGPVDSLDHASRLANYGSKMGVDATQEVARGRIHAPLAGRDPHAGRGFEARGRNVEASRPVK